MFKVKITKLTSNAIIPRYAQIGDAGMDLFSVEDLVIQPCKICLVHTGIVIELPANTEAQVRSRSGLALNYGIVVLNSPGTIDEGYRGEIGVILINHGNDPFVVESGMRIAQLVVKPVFPVEFIEATVLSSSSRGDSGFGSSGIGLV